MCQQSVDPAIVLFSWRLHGNPTIIDHAKASRKCGEDRNEMRESLLIRQKQTTGKRGISYMPNADSTRAFMQQIAKTGLFCQLSSMERKLLDSSMPDSPRQPACPTITRKMMEYEHAEDREQERGKAATYSREAVIGVQTRTG